MLKKKIKNKDVGKIITTAEVFLPFGNEFIDVYKEHTYEIQQFIGKHIPTQKGKVELRWEELSVIIRAEIDDLYEVIYLVGYSIKMIDGWITEAVSINAQEKLNNIQELTGNLNIN